MERESTEAGPIAAVVFDVGGVLIDWDPRHLYRKIFTSDHRMELFLGEICTPEWHAQHDLGVAFDASVRALVERHPGWADEIRAWGERFEEMWSGPVPGSVEVLAALRESDHRVPLYAATNWGSDTWELATTLFPFLTWFDGALVSARVGLLKPDPRFFDLLVQRFDLDPPSSLYIDDNAGNIDAASRRGFVVCRFTGAAVLARRLEAMGLLPEARASGGTRGRTPHRTYPRPG